MHDVRVARPDAEVKGFRKVHEVLRYAEENICDVLLCEICLKDMDGIVMAEKLQKINPKMNIIFITVCNQCERAKEVIDLRVSGYLTKPYTRKQLRYELQLLRHGINLDDQMTIDLPEELPPERRDLKAHMTDKDLKRMSRTELLQMLIDQVKENEELKDQLEEANKKLEERVISVNNAGSIAEAALQINGVFEAAELAAKQYLENVQMLTSRQESICKGMQEDAQRKADMIVAEAEIHSKRVRSEADEYWEKVVEKAQALLRNQESLRELVESGGRKFQL